jgi:hypothetical protein
LCDESVPLAVEALDESRLLITYDRDFGTLLFRDRIRPAPLVLYVRTSASPSANGPRVLEALEHVELGHFLVIDGDALRKRPIES